MPLVTERGLMLMFDTGPHRLNPEPVPCSTYRDSELRRLGFSKFEQVVSLRAISGGRGFAPAVGVHVDGLNSLGMDHAPPLRATRIARPCRARRSVLARGWSSARRSWYVSCDRAGGLRGLERARALAAECDHRPRRADARRRINSAAPTGAVLLRFDLLGTASVDPGGAARILEKKLEAEPVHDGALALAEVSYQAGLLERQRSPKSWAWYRDAAVLASLALEESAGSRPDLAVRIHNGAVSRLIRASQAEARQPGRNWRRILEEQGVAITATAPYLNPKQIANLRVAADLQVKGMDHVYQRTGLGVPLVAHRVVPPDENTPDVQDVQDEFLPRDLRTGATAVMKPGGGLLGGEWRKSPATLTLLDSFGHKFAPLADRNVELACDRTTPLAARMAGRRLAMLEWTGLFDSRFNQQGLDTALYMSRPYEPGKIPVIFVHGLVSSPRAWVKTINELENTPLIDSRYQFWVFLYPTGLPDSLLGAAAARITGASSQRGRSDAQRPGARPHGPGRPQHGWRALQDDGAAHRFDSLECRDHRPHGTLPGTARAA